MEIIPLIYKHHFEIIKLLLNSLVAAIPDRLSNTNKDTFTRLFESESDLVSGNKNNIVPCFEMKITELKAQERFSTLVNNTLALGSLLKYKKDICFEDVDKAWLKGYVQYMLSIGNLNVDELGA